MSEHDTEEQRLQPGDPETTGHSWDGIREFNNPLPRWWLWTFYGTCIWALLYTIAYPAWPLVNSATSGILGYSTRAEVAQDIARFEARNAPLATRLEEIELAAVTPEAHPDLYNYAVQAGGAVFGTNCSQCHGRGGAGVQAAGYPNLLDNDWLWGGTPEEIRYTIAHGIRNEDDPDARYSEMTAYDEILSDAEIDEVVNHVMALSDPDGDNINLAGHDYDPQLAETGEEVFLDNCAACHMDAGTGDPFLGAPNLTDAIWLYGGDPATLEETVRYARFGVMPPWTERLSEAEIRAAAIWVHSRGGGE